MIKIKDFIFKLTNINRDIYKKIAVYLIYYLVILIFNI